MGAVKRYSNEIAAGCGFVSRAKGAGGTGTNGSKFPRLVRYTFYAKYSFAADGGAQAAITPVVGDTIPANALVDHATVVASVAVDSLGSATVAIGTSAGSAANSILTATAKASLGLAAVVPATCNATPFRMSAAGNITFTIGAADLTVGVVEVQGSYWIPANAA